MSSRETKEKTKLGWLGVESQQRWLHCTSNGRSDAASQINQITPLPSLFLLPLMLV